MDHYRLVGDRPIIEPDLMAWAEWFEATDRTVARTQVGEAKVSTIFLGFDHRWGGSPPILYETMIFGGPHHHWKERYATRAEAQAAHEAAVRMLQDEATSLPCPADDGGA